MSPVNGISNKALGGVGEFVKEMLANLPTFDWHRINSRYPLEEAQKLLASIESQTNPAQRVQTMAKAAAMLSAAATIESKALD